MKKNLLFPVFLCVFNLSFSQVLPELPMKNDVLYYSFNKKFEIKKKCLYRIGGDTDSELKLQQRIREKLKGRYGKAYDNLDLVTFGGSAQTQLYLEYLENGMDYQNYLKKYQDKLKSCTDTVKGGVFQLLIPGKLNLIDYTVLGVVMGTGKKKPFQTIIKSETQFNYISENELVIIFKKFWIEMTLFDGSQMNKDLSEIYLNLKNKDDLTKSDVKIFTELDEVLNLTVDAITEQINWQIKMSDD
jgi:hypothetical protein